MFARYYGNGLGRFLSKDPASKSINLFDPYSWHRYTYTRNNPLNFFDPDGEEPYHCSRPTLGGARHGFIVHDAGGVGQGGKVRSYGESSSGKMGEVTAATKNTLSEGTWQKDKAAWESAGTPNSTTSCVELNASDAKVASLADSVMETENYEAVPIGEEGLNSNSGSTAIAVEATGECGDSVMPEGGEGMVGSEKSNDVEFDENTDGVADERETQCPERSPTDNPSTFGGKV
jgi:hypothetical protein